MSSSDQVLQRLEEAFQGKELSDCITLELLPVLAEALAPHLSRYQAKHGSFPSPKIFLAIVENFNQDGPLVAALLDGNRTDNSALWDEIRHGFLRRTQKRWPDLETYFQEEITSQTLIRLQRYLSNFLFQARFTTWAYTVWQNEYRRLMKKLQAAQIQEVSLDAENKEGLTLSQTLTSPGSDPQETVENNQVRDAFWDRMAELDTAVNVRILRLHLNGYTLEEIKQALGPHAPSIATIKRRKDKIIARLKKDEQIKRIALRMGILPDEH